MPPGTGDVALSLSQTVPVAGAIVVTTPQQVSLADSRRAVAMYRKLNIPPLGIIENMSYFVCGHCHDEADIFGRGGGAEDGDGPRPAVSRTAFPSIEPIRQGSDAGVPLLISAPESPAARAFMSVAEQTAAQISIASYPASRAHSLDGGAMSRTRACGGGVATVALSMVLTGCAPRPETAATPKAGSALPSAIVDPYLKIASALAKDSIDGVRANAGELATAATALGAPAMKIDTAAVQLAAATEIADARDKVRRAQRRACRVRGRDSISRCRRASGLPSAR